MKKRNEIVILAIVLFFTLNIFLLCLCKSESFANKIKTSIFELTGVEKDACIGHVGEDKYIDKNKDLTNKCDSIEFVNKEDWGAVNRNRLNDHNIGKKCLNACFDNWEVRRDNLYKLLKNVVKVCNKLDLEWTLYYGGLLGWYRNKELIPWDPDIDVLMPYQRTMDKFKGKTGVIYEDDEIIFDLKGHKPIMGLFIDKQTLLYSDIFFWEDGKNVVNISWMGKGDLKIKKSDFYPLKKEKLNKIDIMVPSNPKINLTTRYGNISKKPYKLKDGKFYLNK
jgi:hypothetical protein